MPSQVWGRDPQEAYENPYEYSVQEQFDREASSLLERLYGLLQQRSVTAGDETAEKAVWMLHVDALDSLDDALDGLRRKRHRVAGKCLRDVLEAVNLAAYFASGVPESKKALGTWFSDEIVSHREYRNFVKTTDSERAAEESRQQHRHLSKFTHRTYRVLMDGYSLGGEDRMVHDRYASTLDTAAGGEVRTMLVLPETIAAYYARLAEMIMVVARELSARGSLEQGDVAEAIKSSLESQTVPRRFMPPEWLREALSNKPMQTDAASPRR